MEIIILLPLWVYSLWIIYYSIKIWGTDFSGTPIKELKSNGDLLPALILACLIAFYSLYSLLLFLKILTLLF